LCFSLIEPDLRDNWSDNSSSFIKTFFGFLLRPDSLAYNLISDPFQVILRKGFAKVVDEVAALFTHAPEFLTPALKTILSLKETTQIIRSMGLDKRIDCDQIENLQI
jgi:hypothetical protein